MSQVLAIGELAPLVKMIYRAIFEKRLLNAA
jgi:hypothetical protein